MNVLKTLMLTQREQLFVSAVFSLSVDLFSPFGILNMKYPVIKDHVGHGSFHAKDVAVQSFKIAQLYDNLSDPKFDPIWVIAGMCHDIGRHVKYSDLKGHHNHSVRFVEENFDAICKSILFSYPSMDRDTIEYRVLSCICHHRENCMHNIRIPEHVIQIADKLRFTDIKHLVERAFEYRINDPKFSHSSDSDLKENVYNHIITKFNNRIKLNIPLFEIAKHCGVADANIDEYQTNPASYENEVRIAVNEYELK